MGVRFLCPNGHKLHVKSFLSGKRGICPQCDARFIVPASSGIQAEHLSEDVGSKPEDQNLSPVELPDQSMIIQTAPPAPANIPLPDLWFVCTAEGQQYGPADSQLMKSWIAEGRVADDCQVWHAGWPDWKRAEEAVTMLGESPPPPPTEQVPEITADPVPLNPNIESHPHPSTRTPSHQRARRERARLITIALGGLVLLLLVAILLVIR